MKKLFLWMIMVIISCQYILATPVTWSIDFSSLQQATIPNQKYEVSNRNNICTATFTCDVEFKDYFKFQNHLRLPSTTEIRVQIDKNYKLTNIKFFFTYPSYEFRSDFSYSTGTFEELKYGDYEFIGQKYDYRNWEPDKSNTTELIIRNGSSSSEGNVGRMIGMEITYDDAEPEEIELPVGPVPNYSFNELTNEVSFSIPDGFTDDFLDRIYYCWMPDESTTPSQDDLIQYKAPHKLENKVNYIWAMTKGNGEWQDSELTFVGKTVYKPKASKPVIQYNSHENTFTLSHSNEDFSGYIEYVITDDYNLPEDDSFTKYENEPVQLDGYNKYIWARCVGDDSYTDSDLERIGPTVFKPYLDAPKITGTFDKASQLASLTVDNNSFNGIIEYCISLTPDKPENVSLTKYEGPITITESICYVWARTSGDPAFMDSELDQILSITHETVKESPVVSTKFDEDNNTLSLFIEDESFKGNILYAVTTSDNKPNDESTLLTYRSAIQLADSHNFIWYKTIGDPDFKDSDLKCIELIQRPLAPEPLIDFDPATNSFTLSTAQPFDGHIEYLSLTNSDAPLPGTVSLIYTTQVQLTDPVNYIWARCIGNQYRPGDFIFLSETHKFEPKPAPKVTVNYNPRLNSFSLSIDDKAFKGSILYSITGSNSEPKDNTYFVYEPGSLIKLDSEQNHIWYKTIGDSNYLDSKPQYSLATYEPLPSAPVPIFSFDRNTEMLSFIQNNPNFKGTIEYVLSTALDVTPEKLDVATYTTPLKFSGIAYYVWARCTGDDNFEPGVLTYVGRTEPLGLKDAPVIKHDYNETTGILELSVEDSQFNGNIAYIITDNNLLSDENDFKIYTEPLELTNDANHIWLKTINAPQYKESDFEHYSFDYHPLPFAPDPEMNFDALSNTLTLYCPDNEFKGYIEYITSTVNKAPTDLTELQRYLQPIKLTDPSNYVWARCAGDPNFRDSKLKSLGRTEAEALLPAPQIDSIFDTRRNILTLSVKDPNFKGHIEYLISKSNQSPTDYSKFILYDQPIVLIEETNHVWVRTTSDPHYKDSEPQLFNTIFEPLPAPDPILTFDKRTNIISLSLDDKEFNGVIKYCLMTSDATPAINGNFEVYTDPFKATNNVNYVWAFSSGDKYYKDSELKFLGKTEYSPIKAAPIINVVFDNIKNTISFAIADANFKGSIKYLIGETDTKPSESAQFVLYESPISLERPINYIWYLSEGDEDYTDSDLLMVTTNYNPLPVAPAPILSFNKNDNTFTLKTTGSYDGKIEYYITQTPDKPSDDTSLITYTGTVTLTADENYVWARCVGNNSFTASELICVGHTVKKTLKEAPEINVIYDEYKNILELSISDTNFEGNIEYRLTKVNAVPEEDAPFKIYSTPLKLDGEKNYVWYRCNGDPEYKPGSILLYVAQYVQTTEPPVVKMIFDNTNNSFTLSTPGSSFDGRIEYCITHNTDKPTGYSDIKNYESTVYLSPGSNYIWARCVDDPNFANTGWQYVGQVNVAAKKEAPEIHYNFDTVYKTLTLSILDTDYKGKIEYIISYNDNMPDETTSFTVYSAPIKLDSDKSFVWYRCCGDSDYSDSELQLFNPSQATSPIAPRPSLSFNELTNIATLYVDDSSFKGIIEYCVTDSDVKPDDSIALLTFDKAIVLVNDVNYIWARCSGDPNYSDSELTLLGVTRKKILKEAPEVDINFDDTKNIITFSINDANYQGSIKYIVSETDIRPDEATKFEIYHSPVLLIADVNYIWYYISGDADYKDSKPSMIKTVKRDLFTAPIPILKFNPVTNSFTLSINDASYKGYIEYWISQSSNPPTSGQKYSRYDGPVKLSESVNYIWARCAGDPNFKDSVITFLMMTEAFASLEAPDVMTSFDNRSNILTLSVSNPEFKGQIEYIVTETDQQPESQDDFTIYTSPIKLVNDTNFIWYRTCGDSDFMDSELKVIKTSALPFAPTPILSFNELSNTMTLSVDNISFKGMIEYCVTETEKLPENFSLVEYTASVTLLKEENFVWAHCVGDENFRDSKLILIGHTKHKILKESPIPLMKFNPIENSFTLTVNDSNFNGIIEYLVSATASTPGASMKGNLYEGNVKLENETNYIWARCTGDPNYKESSFIMMGMTEAFVQLQAPEVLMNFDSYNNVAELSVNDPLFTGSILFAVTETDDMPAEDTLVSYGAPIQLDNDTNYIWAKTTGDISYEADTIHLVGMTVALPLSPLPLLDFNPFTNTAELLVNDATYNGRIFIAITSLEDCPELDSFVEYTGVISLKEDKNYIWSYTAGDSNYRNPKPSLIGITEAADISKLQSMSFRLIPDGASLDEGEQLIITHHQGNSIYALGNTKGDSSHKSVHFPGKQVNFINTYLEELNYYGIVLFEVKNGHLTELGGDNYLTPYEESSNTESRALSTTAPYNTTFISTELSHSIMINDMYLVGDTEGFRFSNEPGNIYVYTTREDFTGVDEISIVDDSMAEYFNLQGQKVLNPVKGFYIEKKGASVRKVFINK